MVYDAFMRGEIEVEGKDLNDMVTGEYGTDPAHYTIFNVMLPRRYHPAWQGNVFERVGLSIAEQLCGEGMVLDFDQLLAKHPGAKTPSSVLAPGPGLLDQHRRPAHRNLLAGRRRLHRRERVHAVPSGQPPGGGAAAPAGERQP